METFGHHKEIHHKSSILFKLIMLPIIGHFSFTLWITITYYFPSSFLFIKPNTPHSPLKETCVHISFFFKFPVPFIFVHKN